MIRKGPNKMNAIITQIRNMGIVPVVVLEEEKDAIPLAKALWEGGLPCAEVTFRTDAAEESIRRMTTQYPEMLIGAGTILTTDQAKRAVEAGAKFIVSPGFDEEVVDYCLENQVPILPGCCTPTEVIKAVKKGLNVVKFFPAEQAGGLPMMKAMGAAFPEIQFMPTGGISLGNLSQYLGWNRTIACGGSWMVPTDLIKVGAFDEIQKLTQNAVEVVTRSRE